MKERILQISETEKLSHIGSCLTAAEVLEEIYATKRGGDIVVLDEGHAHLAHLVAREKYEGMEEIEDKIRHDIHCNIEAGCYVDAGSLGLAGAVSLGLALAKPDRNVYVMTSDGALAEGIWWEVLRIKAANNINNLKVYVNANGWGALGPIDTDDLMDRLQAFDPTVRVRRTSVEGYHSKVTGLAAHYVTI